MLRLADFFMRLEARLSYALIGLVQATGYAGGLDFYLIHSALPSRSIQRRRRKTAGDTPSCPIMI